MAAEVPKADRVVSDLSRLIDRSITGEVLKSCQNLMEVARRFDDGNYISAVGETRFLKEILWAVAEHVRQRALAQYKIGDPAESQTCQAAAVTELLCLAGEDFEVKFSVIWDSVWKGEKKKSPPNSKWAGDRRLRATAWIGKKNVRYTYPDRLSGRRMLEAFAGELFRDDPAVRAHLTARLRELSAQPAEATASSAASAADTLQPAPDTDRPPGRISPVVFDTLLQLAGDTRRQLQEDLFSGPGQDKINEIPVRWRGVDKHYFDPWEKIHDEVGLTEPIPLGGTFAKIASFFEKIPSKRLVILGPEGAGKTTLAMKLACDLLSPERWREGYPVPVVFDLQSWENPKQSLHTWLAEQLVVMYPYIKQKIADQLVKDGHVLPILDGFDEIATFELRTLAARKINYWLMTRGGPIVLTSRSAEYYAVVDNRDVRVLRAPAIELCKLEYDDVADYLRLSTHDQKWQPVIARMDPSLSDEAGERLRDALSTPLMAFLARSVYQHPKANPKVLLEGSKHSHTSCVEQHLIDAFVPVVFWNDMFRSGAKVKPKDAERWLGFIAKFLIRQKKTYFAWWSLGATLDRVLMPALASFLLPFIVPLFLGVEIFHSPRLAIVAAPFGIVESVLVVAVSGIYARPMVFAWRSVGQWLRSFHTEEETTRFLWLSLRLENSICFVLVIAGILGPIVDGRSPVLGVAVLLALFGLGPVIVMATPYTSTKVISPSSLLRLDRRAALNRALLYGAAVIVLSVLALIFDRHVNPLIWIFGMPIVGGLMVMASASGMWFVSCLVLASRKLLPIHCMKFLEHARRLGVLRQVAGVYQFRHRLMRDRLAQKFDQMGGRLPGDKRKARKTWSPAPSDGSTQPGQ